MSIRRKWLSTKTLDEKLKYIKLATKQLIDQATFVPLFYEKIPIIVNKKYYMKDYDKYGETIQLWQVRKNRIDN